VARPRISDLAFREDVAKMFKNATSAYNGLFIIIIIIIKEQIKVT